MIARTLLFLVLTAVLTGSAVAQVPGRELLRAAQDSKFSNVIKLVRSGVDPSQQDLLGKNALMLILEAGHPDLAISFVNELKARLKSPDSKSEPWREIQSDWVFAAARKVQTLNASDSQGRTPLMIAAANGYAEVVRMLIADGAEVDTHNREGKTAAMIAEQAGHPEIVAILSLKSR